MPSDGAIVFKTKIDNSDVQKDLDRVKRDIEKSQKTIAESEAAKLPLLKDAEQLKAKLQEARQELAYIKDEQAAAQAAIGGESLDDHLAAYDRLPALNAAVEDQQKKVDQLEKEWSQVNSKVENYDRKINKAKASLEEQKAAAGKLSKELTRGGINMSGAMEKAQKSADKFKKRLASIVSQVFVFTLVSKALQGITKYMGKALKSNKEFTSELAKLKGALLTAFQPIYEMLLPALMALLRIATSVVTAVARVASLLGGKSMSQYSQNAKALYEEANAIEETGEAAKKAQRSLAGFDEINQLGDNSLGNESESTDTSAPDFSAFDTGVVKQLDTVLEKISGFGEKIAVAFQPTVSSWSTAFSSLLPAVQDTVSRIGAAWNSLWDTSLAPFASRLVTEWIPSIVNTFSETFAPIFADVMPVAMDIWATSFENTCLIVSEWTAWLGEGFDKIKTIFTDMCESIKSNWDTYGGGLLVEFQTFVDGAWDTWWKFYDEIIAPVFVLVSDTVDQVWAESLKPLWDKLVDFTLSIGTDLLVLWNTVIKPLVDWVVTFLGPVVESVAGWILETVKDTISVVMKVIGGVLDSVKKIFNGIVQFLSGVFAGNWKKAWSGIVDIFKGLFNGISTVAKGIVNTIILALNTLIGAIYSGISGVVNGLGNVVSTVGKMLGKNWGFSIPTTAPKIPYLAQGAVIPPNREFLAVLGDQKHGTNIEAPLSTIQEAVAGVMADYETSNLAGHEATVEVLQQLLAAVLGIEVGDTTIGQAANRYNEKMAIIKGRL